MSATAFNDRPPAADQSHSGFPALLSRLDLHAISVLLLVIAVVLPRSISIARAHSETYDSGYHILRGLSYLTGTLSVKGMPLNDPPLGEGLIAIPVFISNLREGRAADDDRFYDVPGRAERLARRIAAWNTILYLPLVLTVFCWTRSLYGLRAAWLSSVTLAVEPNLAAHIPLATLDVVGITAIVVSCYLSWQYFMSPSGARLVIACTAIGTSMMIKHTAVILPAVFLIYAALSWSLKPFRDGVSLQDWKQSLAARSKTIVLAGLITLVTIWLLTLPELRSVFSAKPRTTEVVSDIWKSPWFGGVYLRAFREGLHHGRQGHPAYLLGEIRQTGWWYYFPVVATYKLPIGIGLLFLLGILSLRKTPAFWAEWGLFVPFVAYALFMMNSRVNIGFRHFLPAVVFALALASRCLVARQVGLTISAWLAVTAAGLHAWSFHPDFLSYINYPRREPYYDISDSNVDWGQGQKQIRQWLDSNPHPGRIVWLRGFSRMRAYYLGDRVRILSRRDPRPTSGLLIISPVSLLGIYDPNPHEAAYRALRGFAPDAIIGHSLLVFDLDRLSKDKGFDWSRETDAGTLTKSPASK
jgi:hypothetical protein